MPRPERPAPKRLPDACATMGDRKMPECNAAVFLDNDNVSDSNFSSEDFRRLEKKIDALDRKISLIFGDSVLINNQFINIKK